MAAPDLPRNEILAAAEAAGRLGPVPLIFATEAALYLLDNWLDHANRAGLRNTILVALDDAAAAHPHGPECVTVRVPFDGGFAKLWLLRLHVFEALARHGIDFVHSDLDAVWLGDARPDCFADPRLDAVFSQGLFFPLRAHAAWGFVLCCGLFAVRAGAKSAGFLAAVRERWATEQDDQVAVNLVLLESGMAWQDQPAGDYQITVGSRAMTCYREMLRGASATLGLNVGMLPFHRVPRLVGHAPEAVVRHPYSTRAPADRIAALRKCGVWPASSP